MFGKFLNGIRMLPWLLICSGKNVVTYILLLLVFTGCSESSVDELLSRKEQSFIEVGETKVPVFTTAVEQLNYTRSWFADIQEKRAALQAFFQLFPQERKMKGLAALDLAYLQLGNDFRFAPEHSCFAAIKDYRTILSEYQDKDEISAKALWYIGWIYTNLLNEKEKGITTFTELVEKYPEENVSLLPPAPWVSIIYEADESMNTALYYRPMNYWAALALLEIVKHSSNGEEAWNAFEVLWLNYRQDKATGFALKAILKRRSHTVEALERARQYMEKDFSNVHILGDIQQEINTITGTDGGPA